VKERSKVQLTEIYSSYLNLRLKPQGLTSALIRISTFGYWSAKERVT